MKSRSTIYIPTVLKLFEQRLGLAITRPTLYHYMKKKNFPRPRAIEGSTCRPSRWQRIEVERWLKKQMKKSKG